MAKRYEKQLNQLFDYLAAVHQELVGSRRRRWVFDLDEELPFPFDDEEEATRNRGEGFVAERWQEVAPERYMAAQGLTEQERRLVRVLLMQALLERTSFRPFCGRLSQLMPLLVRERSSGEQFEVLRALLPTSRLRKSGIVRVQGALLGDDPRVKLSEEALVGMLGESVFVLLGLEPLSGPKGSVPEGLELDVSQGLLVSCGASELETVAGMLARLTGGMAWRAPKELDVDALPEELLVGAFRVHGGVLVLEEGGDYMKSTLRKLSRQIPVLEVQPQAELLRVKHPAVSAASSALERWLASVLAGGDGVATEAPVLC
jgi:hypothetical protein